MFGYTILNPIIFMLCYEILWKLSNKCLYVFLDKAKGTKLTGVGGTLVPKVCNKPIPFQGRQTIPGWTNQTGPKGVTTKTPKDTLNKHN